MPSERADATLALIPDPATDPAELSTAVTELAAALAADDLLRIRLDRGFDLAVVPPSAAEPATPLYTR
jgi:hypothetical protein